MSEQNPTSVAAATASSTPTSIYKADEIGLMIPGGEPVAQPIPHGTDVDGVWFDGYPQIVKNPKLESTPVYDVRKEKDIEVAMRDGVRLMIDVYRPDVESAKFPAILAYGRWATRAATFSGLHTRPLRTVQS